MLANIYRNITHFNNIMCHCYENNILSQLNMMILQVRWKKKRRKREKFPVTPDILEARSRTPATRLVDRIGAPEPSYVMAKTIRNEISRVSRGIRTTRHFAFRNKFRKLGLEHFLTDGSNLPSTFVTPLTKLQHQSNLPRTFDTNRFTFPHALHYKIIWRGEAVVKHTPLYAVAVTFNLYDLPLNSRQIDHVKEILGPQRFDESSGIAMLYADIFPELNHNAAYLGDITECLIKEAKKFT
ncbi:mitochondrial ribosomal protein S35 precursor, putative [Babesia microti strain RI]|uniref:Mitochondrial ribosomal protein S35, putative n=1 Tax=Babesia microti (strain RI) TaxID=1133968 RepID=A0A1N6LXK9_BABMR|nr:mitochondrial ribosomal protein S35 precursor, putative [Babesia microti strain RI]SIO73603.1 mitochondrial ribosomal protein S35 precursor, putative [Babesia microti strain RI]|eukprot:XP_021337687.1 mitochondrial ribosomal protein S35 precursor, putative [Babesia microti strain RI]